MHGLHLVLPYLVAGRQQRHAAILRFVQSTFPGPVDLLCRPRLVALLEGQMGEIRPSRGHKRINDPDGVVDLVEVNASDRSSLLGACLAFVVDLTILISIGNVVGCW